MFNYRAGLNETGYGGVDMKIYLDLSLVSLYNVYEAKEMDK